jgi:hypothetical protein
MKVQLNLQVSPKLAEKIRMDATRNRKKVSDVGAAIIGEFFKAWTVAERAKFYTGLAPKIGGRRVAALVIAILSMGY